MKSLFKITFLCVVFLSAYSYAGFLEEFPELKKHVYQEPKSRFFIGLGACPIGLVQSKTMHTLSAFQLHWSPGILDWEIFNASVGITSFSKETFANSRHFIFRTVPKIQVFNFLSVGPLLGFEYVSFPDIKVNQVEGEFQTPSEAFSSRGVIYGAALTETFLLKDAYRVKIAQVFYKQTYPTDKASNGWVFRYDRAEIENDPEKKTVKPNYVILLEFSLLF